MAWRWQAQIIEAGVVADPRDFSRNEDEFAQEMAGYFDRDNVGAGQITSAKIASKALVSAGSNPQQGAPLQVVPSGSGGVWVTIDALTTPVSVDEGELIVDVDVECEVPAPAQNHKWQARVLLDGSPIAYTGWTAGYRKRTTVSLTGSAPVVNGSSSVTVQVRMWTDAYYHIADIAAGKPATMKSNNTIYLLNDTNVLSGNVVWVHRKR